MFNHNNKIRKAQNEINIITKSKPKSDSLFTNVTFGYIYREKITTKK